MRKQWIYLSFASNFLIVSEYTRLSFLPKLDQAGCEWMPELSSPFCSSGIYIPVDECKMIRNTPEVR